MNGPKRLGWIRQALHFGCGAIWDSYQMHDSMVNSDKYVTALGCALLMSIGSALLRPRLLVVVPSCYGPNATVSFGCSAI